MPLARMVIALVVVLTVGMLFALLSLKRGAEGETSVSQLGQHAEHAKVKKEPLLLPYIMSWIWPPTATWQSGSIAQGGRFYSLYGIYGKV